MEGNHKLGFGADLLVKLWPMSIPNFSVHSKRIGVNSQLDFLREKVVFVYFVVYLCCDYRCELYNSSEFSMFVCLVFTDNIILLALKHCSNLGCCEFLLVIVLMSLFKNLSKDIMPVDNFRAALFYVRSQKLML